MQGNPAVAGGKKVAKMVWCLAEGLRDIDREALSKCSAIILKQDERAGFALQRFCSSSALMERRTGISHASRPDTGSSAIRDAVHLHLKRACTRRLDPPGKVKKVSNKAVSVLDHELLSRCCKSVIFYCPDGASDEQRAGRLLYGKTNLVHRLNGIFSNMKGVLRDPAHASTRITKRPWSATEALSDVFQNMIQKKGSFVNLVKNSPDFQKKFNGWVKRCKESPISGPRIRNLSY